MDNFCILLCKFGDDTVPLKCSKDGTYADLVSKICSNWSSVNVDNVVIYYAIPGHPRVTLRNQDELEMMYSLASDFGLKIIQVCVDRKNVTASTSDIVVVKDNLTVDMQPVLFDNNPLSDIVRGDVSDDHIRNQASSSKRARLLSPPNSSDDCDDVSNHVSRSSEKALLSSRWSFEITDVGQCFPGGAVEFRSALSRYSTALGFGYDYMKNTREQIIAVCKGKVVHGCNWYISASISNVTKYFYIRKLVKEHSCDLLQPKSYTKRLDCNKIGELVVDHLRANPKLTAHEAMIYLSDNYGLHVSYKKAWSGLEKAKSMAFGSPGDSFDTLRWYVPAALDANPGSRITLQCKEKRFWRIFLSFHASIVGFRSCRPVLFLNCTFTKGVYEGAVLCATAKDADRGLFPVAYAVVDMENDDNWHWFLCELKNVIENDRDVVFVSDRNHDLLKSLPMVFSGASRYYCLQHLKINLRDMLSKSQYTGASREHILWLFKRCARAPTEVDFCKIMKELKEKGGVIVDEFLQEFPVENWSNVYGKGCRYAEMSSKAFGSFNNWILDARSLPIVKMIDSIRMNMMEWFYERRTDATKWDTFLCPTIMKKLNKRAQEGLSWVVIQSDEGDFDVLSDPSVKVNIERRTCSCCLWQVEGFPCAHGVAVICRSGLKFDEYVDPYFHTSTYAKIYEELIYPIPTMTMPIYSTSENENDEKILPPEAKRQPGRPKKKKILSRGEQVATIRCGRCGKMGNHNKKTCKDNID